MNRELIKERYRELVYENEALLSKLKRRQFIVSLTRLGVFIAGMLSAVPAFRNSSAPAIMLLLFSAALFLFLIKYFNLLAERIRYRENLIRINSSELNALKGDYSAFNGGNNYINKEHDFANDIDLFGEDSLFRYINRTVTGFGRETLARWLADPYLLKGSIGERQESVKELAENISWRQEFMAHGLGKPLEKDDIESLRTWLDGKENYFSSALMRTTVIVSPLLTFLLLILTIVKLIPVNIFGFMFIFNLLLSGAYLKKNNRIHSLVSRKFNFLESFEKLISAFGKEKFRSQILADASVKLFAGSKSAAIMIKELGQIIQAFDSRLNIFAGLLLNGLILWDFQCIKRLEKWKLETAGQLPEWLELIGEVDALISLSNHAYNNPAYMFPEISEGEPVLEGVGMGHPLIDEKIRVCNDFSMDHKGMICIITGANMAGKSTFLRSVAVNLLLGMTGTTVCAAKFKFAPVILFTSMRTADSLSHNESYFYAELKRLKALKDRMDSGEELFFILDEILKGTNSEDKSTGSKLYLTKLANRNGTGIIATHDISLGRMEKDFSGKIFNKCFEVEIREESVFFDYKLRDGITQHMNAGILMKQMGII